MLSKEEIEKAKRYFEDELHSEKITYNCVNNYRQTIIDNHIVLYKYIQQLESDKQKLIEKLEEESKQLEHDILTMSIDTGNNYSLKSICEAKGMKQQNDRILSILKGESQVIVK